MAPHWGPAPDQVWVQHHSWEEARWVHGQHFLVPTKEKHFVEKASQFLAFYIGQNLCKWFHMVRVIAGNTWKSSDQRKTARVPSPLSSPHPLSENPGSLFLFWRIAFWRWWKPSKLTPRLCLRGNSNAAVFMGCLSLHQYLIPEVNGSACYYSPYLLWQSSVVIQI